MKASTYQPQKQERPPPPPENPPPPIIMNKNGFSSDESQLQRANPVFVITGGPYSPVSLNGNGERKLHFISFIAIIELRHSKKKKVELLLVLLTL